MSWGWKLALGPVLLWQGWWVRRRTPVLPEPEQVRQGQQGEGPGLRFLLLGDSSAAGVGAETPQQSLLNQLISQLARDHRVTHRMMAATGRTTQQMIDVLQQEQVEAFDVVITALGVNDVTTQVGVRNWIDQQQQLLALIRSQAQPQLIIMSGLPPVRDFPALSWPLNAFLGGCADRLDQALQVLCQSQPDVIFHSLRDYPEQALAASDGFHPGPSVYRIWAQRLAALIRAHLPPKVSSQ